MQKIGIVFCIFHEIRFTLNFLCKKKLYPSKQSLSQIEYNF